MLIVTCYAQIGVSGAFSACLNFYLNLFSRFFLIVLNDRQ